MRWASIGFSSTTRTTSKRMLLSRRDTKPLSKAWECSALRYVLLVRCWREGASWALCVWVSSWSSAIPGRNAQPPAVAEWNLWDNRISKGLCLLLYKWSSDPRLSQKINQSIFSQFYPAEIIQNEDRQVKVAECGFSNKYSDSWVFSPRVRVCSMWGYFIFLATVSLPNPWPESLFSFAFLHHL